MFPAERLARTFAVLSAEIFYQKGRVFLSVSAIALGVALGFAVHLINRAATNELAAGVRTLAGEADLEVRGGRAGFPEELYARLARLEGVAAASPVRTASSDNACRTGGGASASASMRIIVARARRTSCSVRSV